MFRELFTKKFQIPERTEHEIKGLCSILFIDDNDFRVVDILKTSGWQNTKLMNDIESLDQKDIRDAHILFVDIQGVGKKLGFKDEGLGIITALKSKYPNKKVVVYSAESTGNRFHRGLSVADERLSKNADPYEFQVIVEKYSKELFSKVELINRIKNQLRREYGIQIDSKTIENNLIKIKKRKLHSSLEIGKIFNIQNAAALATIIKIFFGSGE
ncbi:MAG: hypothetical protein ACOCWG_02370 [bacterium]